MNDEVRGKQALTLIVDDDAGVRDVTRDILQRHGHAVVTAGTSGEALSFCEKRGNEISLILVDVRTGASEPADLVHKIQAFNPLTKVIVTSIYNNDTHAKLSNAHGYLKKPYRMIELLDIVRQVQSIH